MSDPQQPALGLRFYKTLNGGDVVKDELLALDVQARAEVVALLKRRKHRACLPREDSHVRGDLRELRTTYDGQEYRVFYSQEGPHGEILLALVATGKKANRIQKSMDLADKRLATWRANKESSG